MQQNHDLYTATKHSLDSELHHEELPEGWSVVSGYEHVPVNTIDDNRNDSGTSLRERFDAQFGESNWGYMLNDGSSVDVAIIAEQQVETVKQNRILKLVRAVFHQS